MSLITMLLYKQTRAAWSRDRAGLVRSGGRNGFDFDQRAEVQLARRYDGARRPMGSQDLRVDRVDGRPQRDVGNVNRHFQQLLQIAPGCAQDRLDVAEAASRLRLDVPGLGVCHARTTAELSGDVDRAVVDNGMRIVPAGWRNLFATDDFHRPRTCVLRKREI